MNACTTYKRFVFLYTFPLLQRTLKLAQVRGGRIAAIREVSNKKCTQVSKLTETETRDFQGNAGGAGSSQTVRDTREALVKQGILNARILHMLFRCSEGAGSPANRQRPRDDALSKLYISGERWEEMERPVCIKLCFSLRHPSFSSCQEYPWLFVCFFFVFC